MPGEYDIDFRTHPEKYRYSPDEKGVFKVEPYKSELLPLWRYRDEEAATKASRTIREQYEKYRANQDFVGMDMARKYMQMGFTRAMRYAKYPGGRKYDDDGTQREPQTWADPAKRNHWERIRKDPEYQRLKELHQKQHTRDQ
jgi:hypothetical protein